MANLTLKVGAMLLRMLPYDWAILRLFWEAYGKINR
jgi:hypothetical protein